MVSPLLIETGVQRLCWDTGYHPQLPQWSSLDWQRAADPRREVLARCARDQDRRAQQPSDARAPHLGYSEEEINTVGNYWILAKGKNRNKSDMPPAKYFKDVDARVLDRACIDGSLLSYRSYRGFLAARMEALARKVVSRIGLTAEELRVLAASSGPADEDSE